MEAQALRRVFVYNGVKLPDPGRTLTVNQVRDMYTATYPDLATAEVKGPSPVDGAMQYIFVREVGAKG